MDSSASTAARVPIAHAASSHSEENEWESRILCNVGDQASQIWKQHQCVIERKCQRHMAQLLG